MTASTRRRSDMETRKKKFYLPDIYLTAVILPLGIGIIALLAGLLLPWITTLLEYLKK